MKEITIRLSDEQVADVRSIMDHMRDEGLSIERACVKILSAGITNMAYRYERNKTEWQKRKNNEKLLAQLLKEREMRQRVEEEDDDIVARD